MIGYVDVKTSPIHFHAQRRTSHYGLNTVISFELLKLNVGNAMSTSGIFVVPKPGRYFFTFSGLSEHNTNVRIELQVKTETSDWLKVGTAYGHVINHTFSMHATVELVKGNQVRLLLVEGSLHDNETNYTNYVGRLLEEDILS